MDYMTENGKEDEDKLGRGEGIRRENRRGEDGKEQRIHRERRKLQRRWTKKEEMKG